MSAACLSIIYDHSVTAHQPVDQRLDVHRTESHLAVADDDAGLNDVAWHDLGLQAGVDYLEYMRLSVSWQLSKCIPSIS